MLDDVTMMAHVVICQGCTYMYVHVHVHVNLAERETHTRHHMPMNNLYTVNSCVVYRMRNGLVSDQYGLGIRARKRDCIALRRDGLFSGIIPVKPGWLAGMGMFSNGCHIMLVCFIERASL